MFRPSSHPRTLLAGLLVAVAFTACVDAPYAPEDGAVAGPLVFAPNLTLVGPGGAPVASEAQADALTEAFDRVDRFRIVVRRTRDNSIVVDEVITVTPGQEQYDLSVSVTPTSPDEVFLVSLTAMEGETELFSAPPISMKAVPENAASNSAPPAPVNVTLEYSGPGATAASVEMTPATLVLGPGVSGSLTATVLDEEGNSLADVPVSWSTASEAVATVSEGSVTGAADGVTTVTVTTPTGLEASAGVYVVSGTLAYVEEGTLKTREAAGGSAQEHAGGATAPAWSPDGGQLYYVAGGSARRVGSEEAIASGDWPSVSPTGSYLAVERSGSVVFANVDGSLEREGPAGTTPVWADEGTVVVGGGSIQQVDVAGGGRSTVVSGDASLPALGPGGTLAYISGGSLMVQGREAPVAPGASGRPAWSDGGMWLAFQGGEGIMVVPADGSAAPVALPGLSAGADPAWQPSSPLGAPTAPMLSGLDPDPPVPGQPVDVLGGGFDRVIPQNNQIFWPTPDGPQETEVTGVTSGALSTTMPKRVTAGQIRVTNRGGSAVMDFVPSLGALEVMAHTPWNTPVSDVAITLLDASGQEVARGGTDAEGMLLLTGLQPATYTVLIAPPNNYSFRDARTRTLEIGTETLSLDLSMTPLVASVTPDPANPVVAVGQSVDVTVTARDRDGNIIPEFQSSRWGPVTGHLGVGGSGLKGSVVGRGPSLEGGAQYSVALNGQVFVLPATVTSRIEGAITRSEDDTTVPARSHLVSLENGGREIASTHTDGAGRYFFDGLLAGDYVVRPGTPAEGSVSPETKAVTLNLGNPKGKADFHISTADYAQDFRVLIFSGGHTNNNDGILEEFEARYPDLTFETAWDDPPTQEYLATFSMVFLYENGIFSTSKPVGDALAQYVENGGNIVISTFYWQDRSDGGYSTQGWGALEDIDPFLSAGGSEYNYSALNPASVVPHALTEGLTDLWVDSYHGGVTAKPGTTVLASWDDGVPVIGYRMGPKGQRIVAVSMFPGYADYWTFGSDFGGDFYQVWENALRWTAAGSVPSAAATVFRPEFELAPVRARSLNAEAAPADNRTGTRGGR